MVQLPGTLVAPLLGTAAPALPTRGLPAFLPDWMSAYEVLGVTVAQWLVLLGLIAVSLAAGVALQAALVAAGRFFARRTQTTWDDHLLATLPGPARLFLALLFVHLLLPFAQLRVEAQAAVNLVVRCLLIAVVTWFAARFVRFAARFLETTLTRHITDEHRIRSIHTQIAVPQSILRVAIVFVGAALILMQFEVVRTVGVSLLAGVSIAGIAVGLAAQRTIANLLAGIQLAFAQPIKLGDVVVVENEWGRVEEIGLTFVVVVLWDQRRLILPVSYFLEKPFQNWTVSSPELLGTVFLYTDFSVPVSEIRTEVERAVKGTDLWDGRVQGVQVTNLTERTAEVRVLVSAHQPVFRVEMHPTGNQAPGPA